MKKYKGKFSKIWQCVNFSVTAASTMKYYAWIFCHLGYICCMWGLDTLGRIAFWVLCILFIADMSTVMLYLVESDMQCWEVVVQRLVHRSSQLSNWTSVSRDVAIVIVDIVISNEHTVATKSLAMLPSQMTFHPVVTSICHWVLTQTPTENTYFYHL